MARFTDIPVVLCYRRAKARADTRTTATTIQEEAMEAVALDLEARGSLNNKKLPR
jgi:hypothetical protein